jgi:hypothetical protein
MLPEDTLPAFALAMSKENESRASKPSAALPAAAFNDDWNKQPHRRAEHRESDQQSATPDRKKFRPSAA